MSNMDSFNEDMEQMPKQDTINMSNQTTSSSTNQTNTNNNIDNIYTYNADTSTGESPLKLGPRQKRQKLGFDSQKCIICQDTSTQKLVIATTTGKRGLITSAKLRKDNVYTNLTAEFNDTDELEDDEEVNLLYHRKCYQSYTSKRNISFMKDQTNVYNDDDDDDYHSVSDQATTRSDKTKIDWMKCVICLCKSHKKDKKLHKIETFERASNLIKAAKSKNDTVLLRKIETQDLIAKEALYHSSCMSTYVRKLSVENTTAEHEENQADIFEIAFDRLIAGIDEDIMENKKAFYLSSLREIYQNYLPPDSPTIRNYRLQQKLVKHYGEKIVIQKQQGQGKSNVVLSSGITLYDAIHSLSQLKKVFKETEEQLTEMTFEPENEMEVLRNAASILRNRVADVPDIIDYPCPSNITQEASEECIPAILLQFIEWLIDENAYDSSEYTPSDFERNRSVVLAECIIFNIKKSLTAFHLGLAAELHHDYGSKQLIETLYKHGFCIGYDELRRFITSVAHREVQHGDCDAYIPSGIIPTSENGGFIQEGDDNIDINCETIDGKNTYHSMARVVFQHQTSDARPIIENIKRVQEKSLVVTPEIASFSQCYPYEKPKERPQPPQFEKASEIIKSYQLQTATFKDISWVFLRMMSREPLPVNHLNVDQQFIPFWTGFNSMMSKKVSSYTVVAYAPTINAKPADLATVFTTMQRCKTMTEKLGQKYSVQTMDQQLYVLAQQIKWQFPDIFENHILRLGGFHTLCCYIASIGKIWGDSGLRDLLCDSDVYAPNTVDQMLVGKQFHRSVRGITMAYEALMHVYITSFLNWCKDEGHLETIPDSVWDTMVNVQTTVASRELDEASFTQLELQLTEHLAPLMNLFDEYGSNMSPLFQHWKTFLEVVQILLVNIRAERDSNWAIHISSLSAMLPYMFSANRMNYSRWLPVYILDMHNIPIEVKTKFESGEFVYREKPGKFNGLWTDLGVEKTVIRDSKSDSGIIGMTRKESSLTRWTLTRHVLGQYSSVMKLRSGITHKTTELHDEILHTTMVRDEKHVKTLIGHITSSMTNPFDADSSDGKLLNISTGLQATDDVQKSLINVHSTGERMLNRFVTSSLSDKSKSFYSPISKSGLKTFTDMSKKTKLHSAKGKAIMVSISPELVFRRALTLATCRDDVTLENVMSHPVGPIPLALFHEDGSMRKCVKSDLGHMLESKVVKQNDPPDCDKSTTIYIRDAMAVIQMMPGGCYHMFDEFAKAYMRELLKGFQKANTIADVFDKYDDENSVKSGERDRRSAGVSSNKQYQVIGSRPMPPWKKFLNVSANKKSLTNFICQYISAHCSSELSPNQTVILAGGFSDSTRVVSISSNGIQEEIDFYSNHEEADTRMLLHASFYNDCLARDGNKGQVILKSPDTDVLVIAIYHFGKLENVQKFWIETGVATKTTNLKRFIPVHSICTAHSQDFCKILPAVHALTGCDTTSSFFRIGKKAVYKAIADQSRNFKNLGLIGEDRENETSAARELVATLYDSKSKMLAIHDNLNKMRANLAKKKDSSLARLPPCEDSFQCHVQRASFQTKIWKFASVPNPDIGSPISNGWQRDDGNRLGPIYFRGPTASETLLGLFCTCSSRSLCTAAKCVCFQQSLPCISLCTCEGEEPCCNPNTYSENNSDDEDI